MEIPAVAILSTNGDLLGILSSTHLFSALSRPYGWDVFKRKSVRDFAEPVQTFFGEEPLLLISHLLAAQDGPAARSFYAVVNSSNQFMGLFSQQDLVNYLSQATLRDLELAKALQNQLVKREWRVHEETVWAHGFCEMFKGVGGDFSAFRTVVPGRWFGCVCDVSGKGIAASLVTTLLWGVLEVLDLSLPLEKVIEKINAAVFQAFQAEKFVSGFFWKYNSADGHLIWADMGHSHQFLWAERQLEGFADTPNVPLGIDAEIDVVLGERLLKPGDGLLCYSDGVVENVWMSNHDFPLETVLAEYLATHPEVPAEGIVTHLASSLATFRQAFPVHDDVSMVWFQRTRADVGSTVTSVPTSSR